MAPVTVVLGANGHVGSATATALLASGDRVLAVLHDSNYAEAWRTKGADVAVIDLNDIDALRNVFKSGQRAFLLNPPAPPNSNTDFVEHQTVKAIVAALEGSKLEMVVLESTYGAQPGEALGDLSVLYDFEEALGRQPIPFTVLRAAYYMSNWDALLPAAKKGEIPTMYPPDVAIPMVAPADLGEEAARLLRGTVGDSAIIYVEGPQRYTSEDVAHAFSVALETNVKLAITPRHDWQAALENQGFSKQAAVAYARMTAISVDGNYDLPRAPVRGHTTLEIYIARLVQRASKTNNR
jgi:uncharacterized protein YbjT (DUF2867 family)